MKVELLYFEGCPNAGVAERALRQAMKEEEIETEIVPVAVDTDAEAQRLRFPGSPTVRIDGEDAFAVDERYSWMLTCRTYATSEGLRGAPSVEMLRLALTSSQHSPR